jgi:carbonic anhydrase
MDSVGRRTILRIGAIGGGLALVALARPAAGATEAMLLSCMDYRLLHEIDRYMLGRGLRNKYDQVILAGASLATLTDKYPAWAQTFWEHLEVSIQLHRIHEVIVMDHRDCGAYKVLLGEDFSKDRPKERVGTVEKIA